MIGWIEISFDWQFLAGVFQQVMYTQAWQWIDMSKLASGQAASPYSLEACSRHLPAHLRPGAIALFSYYWHKFCYSVIQSFSFFTPSKRTSNSFTTTRQILDVLFILIFIYIVICTSLLTLTCLYLFARTYLYLCSLYTIMWAW